MLRSPARARALAVAALFTCASCGASQASRIDDARTKRASRASADEAEPAAPRAEPTEAAKRIEPAPSPEPSHEEAPLRAFTQEELSRIVRVQRHVQRAAREHGVESSLINAVIWVESKFEPRARGKRGPRGLMQLMPRTARGLARTLRMRYQPSSPAFNIAAGTYYLARMLELHDGDVLLALASYNMGPGAVRRALEEGRPMPEQIQRYVREVLRARAAFEERHLQSM